MIGLRESPEPPLRAKEKDHMNDVQSVVRRYIQAWNETDPPRRRAVSVEVFAEGADYTDPLASVRGHDDIGQAAPGQREPGKSRRTTP
jgi:hypothetical protein